MINFGKISNLKNNSSCMGAITFSEIASLSCRFIY